MFFFSTRSHTRVSRLILYILMVIFIFSGCRELVKTSKQAYIIDENDISYHHDDATEKKINFDFKKIRLSSVLLVVKIGGDLKTCSGTVINGDLDEKYVLSNAHCFYKDSSNLFALTTSQINELCQDLQVFIFMGDDNLDDLTNKRGKCISGSLHLSTLLDLSVFRVELPSDISDIGLSLGEDKLQGTVMISHFPSYSGGEKISMKIFNMDLELPKQAFTFKNCAISGLFAENLVKSDHVLGYSIGHSCDLESGSSGSGLISYDGTMAGVNWGGVELTRNDSKTYVNGAIRPSVAKEFMTSSFSDDNNGPHLTEVEPQIMFVKADKNITVKKKNTGYGAVRNGCGVVNAVKKDKVKSVTTESFLDQ